MFSKFFRTPSSMIVIAVITLLLVGLITFAIAPPPSVIVTVTFPGMSPNAFVLATLEQAKNGLPQLSDMAFATSGNAEPTMMFIFEPGTASTAAVSNVQKLVQAAKSSLPSPVEGEGITVIQTRVGLPRYVTINSTDENHTQSFLYNFSFVNLLPELKQVQGIGDATLLDCRPRYSMRITLDLGLMRPLDVSAEDVMTACLESSMIGPRWPMTRTSQTIELLTPASRYSRPEQYEHIILKANADGEIVRINDIGKVEQIPPFNIYSDLDGRRSAAIALTLSPGTNTAVVIAAVKKTLEKIKETSFPQGMTIEFSEELPASWTLPHNRPQPGNH